MNKVMVLVVLFAASQAMALTFSEDFESYSVGSTWTVPTGYTAMAGNGSQNHTPSGSTSLLTQNNYGTTKYGVQHLFGETLTGTDANPLSLDYWLTAGSGTHRRRGDTIVMLSMGEIGTDFTLPAIADPALGSAIPVIAYAKPFSDNVSLHFFDGVDWTQLTPSIDSAPLWNQINIDVGTSTVELGTSVYPNYYTGVNARPRAYLGGFDRISVVYEGRAPSGTYQYWVDDIEVTGVPEPATLVFLALGTLLMRRRRA